MVALPAAVAAGILAGLLASALWLSPAGGALERAVADDWIFGTRGPRAPPAGVLVVSVAGRDGGQVARARDDRRLGRNLYAALIERLDALGASVVVMDVAFEDAGGEGADRALERALARSARTVLFQRLARTEVGDVPVPPLARFASAARAIAVFPLPKLPDRVDRYWPFFRAFEPSAAGDDGYALRELPSLPVAALQLQVLERVGVEAFERVLRAASAPAVADGSTLFPPSRGVDRGMSELRRMLAGDRFPREALRLAIRDRFGDGADARSMRSLFATLVEPDALHLNFYGPALTLPTLGHERVLGAREGLRELVADKVVFVGQSSTSAVDQRDGFRTVYTRDDGVDLSGVEIAATAYANLLDGSALRAASASLGVPLHLALGALASLIALRAGVVRAVALSAALAAAYFALAVHAVDAFHRLLPLAVPILVLLPLTLFFALLHRHLRARLQRDRYHRGAQVMVPARAMPWIEKALVERAPPEHLHGTCMITDGAGYTSVAESVGEERLATLSREYFALLEDRTAAAGGELMDFEGDSMTAVWTGAVGDSGRAAAEAAVEIARVTERFNREHADTPLPTRIGLHGGALVFVNIGGGHAYRHRVVGDVVNTASRLEELNKRLGTSALASRAVVSDVETLLLRAVGSFVLKGKSAPLEVVELRGSRASATRSELLLCERFEAALAALRERGPAVAESRFAALAETLGADGPTRFYLDLLRGQGAADVRLCAGGIVRLEGK